MLRRTRLGHHLYAVGGNAEVARLSGLRTSVPIIAAHVLCSVLAAVAGLLLLARLSVGSPTIGSQGGYDLMSIAAVVLGGTLLAGGKGNIAGTLAGVGDLRGDRQRHGRHGGQPVPAGRRPRPRHRGRRRGLRPPRDRPRPARFERPSGLDAALQEAR